MRPLARREQILTEAVGRELVLYDQKSKKAHRLNPTASFLWQHCDGTRSTEDLAKLLRETLNLPEDRELVSLALEQLQKQGLIVTEGNVARVSRRDALKRMKALGIAAAMIPVVATIAAPPPAAALSRVLDPLGTGSNSFLLGKDDPWRKKPQGSNSSDGEATRHPDDHSGLTPWR